MDQHGGIARDKLQKRRREKTEGRVKRRRTYRESSSTEKKDKNTLEHIDMGGFGAVKARQAVYLVSDHRSTGCSTIILQPLKCDCLLFSQNCCNSPLSLAGDEQQRVVHHNSYNDK